MQSCHALFVGSWCLHPPAKSVAATGRLSLPPSRPTPVPVQKVGGDGCRCDIHDTTPSDSRDRTGRRRRPGPRCDAPPAAQRAHSARNANLRTPTPVYVQRPNVDGSGWRGDGSRSYRMPTWKHNAVTHHTNHERRQQQPAGFATARSLGANRCVTSAQSCLLNRSNRCSTDARVGFVTRSERGGDDD